MCTRFIHHGLQGQIFTARSMDWKSDLHTNLWVLPRGGTRSGNCGPNSATWNIRYGSVVATGYDISTTDGVNEAGLVVNLLWLAESEYASVDPAKPLLTIAAWAQYMLDQFASVAEAVQALRAEPFSLVTSHVPGEERLATLHLSMSDSSGDSAIVEYIGGQQVIHHNVAYQVMTNSPTYDEQLALNKYWETIGGTVMLPGTNRAADRFVRASFYNQAIQRHEDPDLAFSGVLSVIRNVSVPFGLSTPDQPNISSTRWRSVVDHARMRYYFESATMPNVVWADLNKIDFSEGSGARKLELGLNQSAVYHGQIQDMFVPAQPFEFLGIKV